MRIIYSSNALAPGGTSGARDIALNDQLLVQPVQLLRALAMQFFPRGNRANDLSFSVHRFFNTVQECELFMLTHRNTLLDTATLYLECGGEGETSAYVQMAGAVLQSVGYAAGSLRGTSLIVSYRFQGGLLSTTEEPALEPYVNMIRRGTVTIASGAQEVAVTFSSTLPTAPVGVQGLVIKPSSGADDLFVTGLVGDPSVTGCTFRLSAPAPNGTYKLTYTAFA